MHAWSAIKHAGNIMILGTHVCRRISVWCLLALWKWINTWES